MTANRDTVELEQEYESRWAKLSADLRALRQSKGRTGRQLAADAGLSQSKISKIETAKQLPTGEDITRIGGALRLSTTQIDKLVREAHALANEFPTRDAAFPLGLMRRQESIGSIERRTDLLQAFQPTVVPGLLQTAEYAQAIMRLSADYSQEDVESGVAARLDRQSILFSDEHSFEFLLHENALRVRLGSASMMRAQIDRLRNMTTLPNVAVMVIPWQTQLPKVPMVGFTLYDQKLVGIELPSNRGEVRRPRDIAVYLDSYNTFKKVALADDMALEILATLDNDYQSIEESSSK